MTGPADTSYRALCAARDGKPLWNRTTTAQPAVAARGRATAGPRRAARRPAPDAGVTVEQTRLDARTREQLLDILERLLEGAYAHLPLKRARYGFEPVQRVRILRARADELDDAEFRGEVNDLFVQLRDLHTYVDWSGRKDLVACLPFIVESYDADGATRYVVTRVLLFPADDSAGTEAPGPAALHAASAGAAAFETGVEIVYWNGMSMDDAVRQHGEQSASGGRPDSRRALALTSLTHRPLRFYEKPAEQWVDVGFRPPGAGGAPGGTLQWARFYWRTVDTAIVKEARRKADRRALAKAARRLKRMTARTPATAADRERRAINPVAAAIKSAKAMRYATEALSDAAGKAAQPASGAPRTPGIPTTGRVRHRLVPVATNFRSLLRAARVERAGGRPDLAYLRIFSFDTANPANFFNEVARLLDELPPHGLILDLRDNEGGSIEAAEWLLQLFTPRRIEPVRFAILASDFARAYCSQPQNQDEYGVWCASLQAAVRTGELYSSAEPISNPQDCNDVGQRYGGPVVLVSSATTYSAGDLFCAGFVDNRIGTYVCVDQSTGAGGACVVQYQELFDGANGSTVKLPPLPEGIDIGISFLRATRCGPKLGTAIEDVGVPADEHYRMTRDDLLASNCDLIAHCIGILERPGATRMSATLSRTRLSISTGGLDRIDVLLDGVPWRTRAVGDRGAAQFTVPAGTRRIDVDGYRRGELKQHRRLPD